MAKKNVRVGKFVDAKATTKVTLTFDDDGDSQTDEFKLRYTAVSPKRQREIDEWVAEFNREEARREEARAAELKRCGEERETALRAAGESQAGEGARAEIERRFDDAAADIERRFDAEERYALAEFLVMMGVQLPEVVGDDDRPAPLTADLLAGWETKNLVAMKEAMRKDANPPATPSGS